MLSNNIKILFLLTFLMPALAFSQKENSSSLPEDSIASNAKNEFHFQLSYQTRLHYYGRTDSLKSSGLTPNIGYQFKNGLYADGTAIFITTGGSNLTYTGAAIEAGYRFPETKHLNGNIFYTHYVYQDKSVLVQSALKGQTGINLVYNNKIANINLGGDLRFSNSTDYGASAGLDHLFIIKTKTPSLAIALNPSVYAYAGTQSFSSTYYEKQSYLGIPLMPKEVTTQERKFNILAYEAMLPVVVVYNKLNFSITPSYIIPQNLIKIPNRPDLSENASPFYYVTLSAGVRL